MLYLNGQVWPASAWEAIMTQFPPPAKKQAVFQLTEKYKGKKTVNKVSRVSFPPSKGIMAVTRWMNSDGQMCELRYVTSATPQPNGQGNKYLPERVYFEDGGKVTEPHEKDLYFFLSVHEANRVSPPWENEAQKQFRVANAGNASIWIRDFKNEAKKESEKVNLQMQAVALINKMKEAELRDTAAFFNIPEASSEEIEIIRAALGKKAMGDPNSIISTLKTNKIPVHETIKAAVKAAVIHWHIGQSSWRWVGKDGEDGFIFQTKPAAAHGSTEDQLVTYLMKQGNDKLLNEIKDGTLQKVGATA